MSEKLQNRIDRALFWIGLSLAFGFIAFPIYWGLNNSFKSSAEMIQPATLIVQNPTFANYESAVNDTRIEESFRNSMFTSTSSVLIALTIGSLAAFALGRLTLKGKKLMLYLVLAMTMFPQISILGGLFQTVTRLGMFGDLSALLFTYPLITFPLTIWMLTNYYRGLPKELEDAAYVDGASLFQIFYRILLPLTIPVMVATGLITFVMTWNEYLYALVFTSVNIHTQPITVVAWQINNQVAFVLLPLPVILMAVFFQDYITEGLLTQTIRN